MQMDGSNFQVTGNRGVLTISTKHGSKDVSVLPHTLPRDVKKMCHLMGVYAEPFSGKSRFKDMYKEFTDKYGITPSNALKKIRGAYYRECIAPVEDLVNKYGFTRRGVSPAKLQSIFDNEEMIRQTEKDGLYNIVPLVVALKRSPKELKILFGKNYWKRVCKNSQYRNRHIAQILTRGFSLDSSMSIYRLYAENFSANKLWLLNSFQSRDEDLFSKALPLFKNLSDKEIKRVGPCIVLDLLADAENLKVSLLTKQLKTAEDVRNYHNFLNAQWREEERKKMYSKEVYPCLEEVKKEYSHKGMKATLLDNAFDIRGEGERMSHCVGGYAPFVEQGNYLVYHIEWDGGEATLGISNGHHFSGNTNSKGEWSYDQMYKSCNRPVEESCVKTFVEALIRELNSEGK